VETTPWWGETCDAGPGLGYYIFSRRSRGGWKCGSWRRVAYRVRMFEVVRYRAPARGRRDPFDPRAQ
jgi:hypothetical protein